MLAMRRHGISPIRGNAQGGGHPKCRHAIEMRFPIADCAFEDRSEERVAARLGVELPHKMRIPTMPPTYSEMIAPTIPR
jgi:hypothetical protein